MNKQYVVKEAYTDNYCVLQYEDGKLTNYTIIAYYEVDGYLTSLQNMGYTQAYYVPEYKAKVDELRRELNHAISEYENAVKNPLIWSDYDYELGRYKRVTCSD